MGTMMSVVISGIITFINTGMDASYPMRRAQAWFVACCIAVPMAVIFSPIARRWAEALSAAK